VAEIKLTQGLAQTQVFTPQMQQALALLQAPVLELQTLIQQEIMQNPVLEEITDKPDSDNSESGLSDDFLDRKIDQMRQIDEDSRAFSTGDRQTHRSSRDDEDRRQFFFDSLAEGESLSEHLSQQLRLATRDASLVSAGEEIIGNLDPDGFLRVPLDDVVASSGLPADKVGAALELLQTFHPVGVAARNLQECLAIQLARMGRENGLEGLIVANHLDALAHHRYDLIAKALKTDVDSVRYAASFIGSLDPKPGRAFLPDERQNVVHPEMAITKVGGEWTVIMNTDPIPRLRIGNEYKDMLAADGDQADLRSYLREKIRAGKALIQCIQQRQQTIEKIARIIIQRQREFLESGVSMLKPLTLSQVADEVGVHETTVSRAISNKYAKTPWGVFELKFFFTPGYRNSAGESFSNKSIKDALQDIIEKEDKKHPYSDEDIIQIFKERGIKLARRTIAKYRSELHILPSSLRRKHD